MDIQVDYFAMIKAVADPDCHLGMCNGEGVIHGQQMVDGGALVPHDVLCTCTWLDPSAQFAIDQIRRTQDADHVQ